MFSNDTGVQEYFDSLPKIVQESIMQCGLEFNNVNDIRNFVEGIND